MGNYYWQRPDDGRPVPQHPAGENAHEAFAQGAVPKRIEIFGEDTRRLMNQFAQFERALGIKSETIKSQDWIAEIVGLHERFGFDRKFLKGKRDYSEANSVGSRGIYDYFLLYPGKLYEVSERYSWKGFQRYFCYIKDGDIVRISKEEALEWVKEHSE